MEGKVITAFMKEIRRKTVRMALIFPGMFQYPPANLKEGRVNN